MSDERTREEIDEEAAAVRHLFEWLRRLGPDAMGAELWPITKGITSATDEQIDRIARLYASRPFYRRLKIVGFQTRRREEEESR